MKPYEIPFDRFRVHHKRKRHTTLVHVTKSTDVRNLSVDVVPSVSTLDPFIYRQERTPEDLMRPKTLIGKQIEYLVKTTKNDSTFPEKHFSDIFVSNPLPTSFGSLTTPTLWERVEP